MPAPPWSPCSPEPGPSPSVRILRATVSPDNAPSLALIAQYPFVEVGEQWDEEDGLETIYEMPVAAGG